MIVMFDLFHRLCDHTDISSFLGMYSLLSVPICYLDRLRVFFLH